MIVDTFLWFLALVIFLISIIPVCNTNRWWVRILDFPRVQIAVAGLVVLTLVMVLLSGFSRVAASVLMLAVCGYQLFRIFPYTSLARSEMALATNGPDDVKLLGSNVLMENKRYDLVADTIDRVDPDILLLMETNQDWVDALEPRLARYGTVIRHPKDNHYGLVFATRLKVDDVRIVYLTSSDTPSVFAQLYDTCGSVFRFVGLHPRPPVPGQSTKERDAQIYDAARFALTSGVPLVTMGDFNDVAWSDTSRTFKHVGGYLDPRIGRGSFASFHAERPWLRFPIDQLYVTPDIAVVSLERLAYVGSDHFPMAATIRLDADLAASLNRAPEPLSKDEQNLIEDSAVRTNARVGNLVR